METMFDLLAVALFMATAGMFFLRFRHEDPPLGPYVLISLSSAVGNWLGNAGHAAFAVGLLIAGAFLLLHIASLPYPEET
ncbi:MAG: XrtV sorting system accessory protein [Parvularculaceae bacterium]